MKNAVIVALVIAVGGLGYLYVSKDTTPNAGNNSSTQTITQQAKTESTDKTLNFSNKVQAQNPKDDLDDRKTIIF